MMSNKTLASCGVQNEKNFVGIKNDDVKTLALLLYVQEVQGSYLDLETGHNDSVLLYPSAPAGIFLDRTLMQATTTFFYILPHSLFTNDPTI